jgi:transcriptional regulator with XRE-family HTH domain
MARRNSPITGENPLQKYKTDHGMTDDELGRAFGIAREQVCRFRLGQRRPNLEDAVAIERATNGEIPAEAWVTIEPVAEDSDVHPNDLSEEAAQ